jgi:hypothetical protein
MMRKNWWKILLGFVGVFIVAFLIALPFFGRMVWLPARVFNRFPVMMHGERAFIGSHMFGGFSMFGMFLFPLLILVLIGAVVYALVRKPAPTPQPPVEETPDRYCETCGKGLQADWKVCPYCGK